MEENKTTILDLIDLKTAGKILNISVFTLKKLLKENNTPIIKQGRSIMIKRIRIEELVNQMEKPYSEVVKTRKNKVTVKGEAPKKTGAKRGTKPKNTEAK